MSMAGGDAAMQLDFTVNTTQLDKALSEADRRITAATRGTGNTIDRLMEKVSQGIGAKLAGAITSGLAINVIDKSLRKVADGIREGQGAAAIGQAIADSVVESIRSIPVAGALMDISQQLADQALGGPMELEAGRISAAAMQQAQAEAARAAPGFMRELQIMGLDGPERTKIEREQYIARVEALMEKAKAGRVQTVDGVEQELVPGTLQEIALARSRAIAAFDVEVNSRMLKEEEARQDRYDRHRKNLENEALRETEEKQRRMREEAKSANMAAIAALEQQLQVAEQAIAPTRAERLASIAAGMSGGISTADTALGAFTFATGDPAQISRDILENAKSQLAALERIEGIQREIASLQKGTGFN